MHLCGLFLTMVCMVLGACVTTMNAAPSDISSDLYMTLLDKLAKMEEKSNQYAEDQMEIRHTIRKLQTQLLDTQNQVSALQNASSMTENEIEISSNKTKSLQMQTDILNGNYFALLSRVESIELDIRTVKSSFIPVYNEIAALKLINGEYRNKTELLEKEVRDLKGITSGLQAKDKFRDDDYIAMFNKVTSGQQSINLVQLNIENLTRVFNTTLISTEKIIFEVENKVLQLNVTNNEYIQNINTTIGGLEQKTTFLESNWSKELHEISIECKQGISKVGSDIQNESKIRESLFNSSSQSLNDIAIMAASLERNLTESIDKLSDTCKHNITKVQTDLASLNTVQYARFRNITNNLNQLETESLELKLNLTQAVYDASIRSLENITMVETGLKNEINTVNIQFNTSLIGLHSDINRVRGQTAFLGSSLTSALHSISTTNSLNTQKVSKLMQEFTTNLESLQRQQNLSITNITAKFYELQDETQRLVQNQTQAINEMSILIAKNLSRFDVDVKDEVRKLSTFYNTSFENLELRMNNFNGLLQIFEQDLLKAVQEVLKQNEHNISNVENEMIIHVNTIQSLRNSSIEALFRRLLELEGQSKSTEANLSMTLSKIALECASNISGLNDIFRDGISRVVMTQNTTYQMVAYGVSDLYNKLNSLSANLSDITRQTEDMKERVVLTACSNTATFTGGSVILFQSIKNSLGLANLSKFELTGKFSGDKPGLYLIAVQIMSYSKGAEYQIVKNGIELSRVQVTPYIEGDAHNYHTGTGVAVVELVPNDEVWIQVHNAVSSMIVFGAESCLTFTKIK